MKVWPWFITVVLAVLAAGCGKKESARNGNGPDKPQAAKDDPAAVKALEEYKGAKLDNFDTEHVKKVSFSTADNDILKHLKGLPKLEHVELTNLKSAFTDEGLMHLKDIDTLRTLDIRACTSITDKGLLALKDLKNMERLKMGKLAVTAKGLAVVKNYPKLKELHFSDKTLPTEKANEFLSYLSDLTNLEILDVTAIGLNDEGLKHLTKLDKLKQLKLRGNNLQGPGMAHLADKSNLELLDLRETYVNDEGLEHLKNLANLKELLLSQDDYYGDEGLKHIGQIKSLRELDLSKNSTITDDGLQHLSGLENLEMLDLRECFNITDDGLAHLKSLTGLKTLKVAGSPQISEDGIAELKKAIPGLKVDI